MHIVNFRQLETLSARLRTTVSSRPAWATTARLMLVALMLSVTFGGLRMAELAAGETPPGPSLTPTPIDPAAAAAAGRESQINELLQLLLTERGELAAMRREAQAQQESFRANRFALERGLAGQEADLVAAQKQEAAAFAASVAALNHLHEQDLNAHRWREQLQAYLPVLREHIARAVDAGRADRLAAVDALIAEAANAHVPGMTPTDLLQRITRLQDGEEALARSIEREPVRVSADREVDGLRVGLALDMGPTDAGALALTPATSANASASTSASTGVATPVSAENARGLGLALQILARRRGPEFSDLFVPALAAPTPAATFVPSPTPESVPESSVPGPVAGDRSQRLPPVPVYDPTDFTPMDPPPPVAAEPPVAAAADPTVARLQTELAGLRAEKAAFITHAAAERTQALSTIGALEKSAAAFAQWLKTARAKIADDQADQLRAEDDLQLAREQQGLFEQALQSTRDQLLERLTGSLEAAAQPALAQDLAALRSGSMPPNVTAADAAATAALAAMERIRQQLATILDTNCRVLAATRAVATFGLQVKLADGRLVQAQCLQVSLLGGYFYDAASGEAGVLVADPARTGVWRGESRGLNAAQKQAIAARIQTPATPGQLPVDVTGGAALIQATHAWSITEWFDAGGKVMWPLLLVALAGVWLVAERAFALMRLQGRTRDLLARVEAALVGGRFDEAQALCDPTRGPVQRVLHAGLIHRADSRTVIEDAIQAAALGEMPALQKGLGMIALLAGLAPLLGLLGTVTGMINTFQMVNLFGSSDTRFLAGGISEALITTEFGLFMAIPLVFCHGVLTRMAERILTSIELGAAILVQRLSNAATPAPNAPNAAKPPAKRDTVVVEAGVADAPVVVTDRR